MRARTLVCSLLCLWQMNEWTNGLFLSFHRWGNLKTGVSTWMMLNK